MFFDYKECIACRMNPSAEHFIVCPGIMDAMLRKTFIAVFLLALSTAVAQQPLPELRTEATAGGSIFIIRNAASQALTAYLIELVDYPGSSFWLWKDDVGSQGIPPGGEKRIPVSNMTVGAVPDYVKLQAALFADGTSSGIPEKVTQLVARRRATLETTRELRRRLEKAQSEGTAKAAVIADLKQWSDSIQPTGRANRNSQAAINQDAARATIAQAAARLEANSMDETLAAAVASERILAASKPTL